MLNCRIPREVEVVEDRPDLVADLGFSRDLAFQPPEIADQSRPIPSEELCHASERNPTISRRDEPGDRPSSPSIAAGPAAARN